MSDRSSRNSRTTYGMQSGKIFSVLYICLFVDHLETAAQRQLGKMFICICLFVLKFEQYCRNSRKAGCANFSTAGNIIRAKSFAV